MGTVTIETGNKGYLVSFAKVLKYCDLYFLEDIQQLIYMSMPYIWKNKNFLITFSSDNLYVRVSFNIFCAIRFYTCNHIERTFDERLMTIQTSTKASFICHFTVSYFPINTLDIFCNFETD